MEMKWEIKRMPGCFKGDPCYYRDNAISSNTERAKS